MKEDNNYDVRQLKNWFIDNKKSDDRRHVGLYLVLRDSQYIATVEFDYLNFICSSIDHSNLSSEDSDACKAVSNHIATKIKEKYHFGSTVEDYKVQFIRNTTDCNIYNEPTGIFLVFRDNQYRQLVYFNYVNASAYTDDCSEPPTGFLSSSETRNVRSAVANYIANKIQECNSKPNKSK